MLEERLRGNVVDHGPNAGCVCILETSCSSCQSIFSPPRTKTGTKCSKNYVGWILFEESTDIAIAYLAKEVKEKSQTDLIKNGTEKMNWK